MYSPPPFEPACLVHELWSSLFYPLWSQDVPDCSECRFPAECSTPSSLISGGYLLRHQDPPGCILTWPGCPRSFVSGWQLHAFSGGIVAPAEFVEWSYETGILKEELTASGAVLAREWLRLRGLPMALCEARSLKESKGKETNG